VLEFFGVVEAFPRYMGAYLARTSFGKRPGGETPPLQERTPARPAATAGLPHARRGYAVTLRRAPSVQAGTWLVIL
jgi:hypothetical protein